MDQKPEERNEKNRPDTVKQRKKESVKLLMFHRQHSGFTSTSRKSWSFLHVAEKVSDVPNSKYHSLFFVLENKQNTGSCNGAEKEGNGGVIFTLKRSSALQEILTETVRFPAKKKLLRRRKSLAENGH